MSLEGLHSLGVAATLRARADGTEHVSRIKPKIAGTMMGIHMHLKEAVSVHTF